MATETQWRHDKFTWPEIKEVIARDPQPVVCIPFGTVEDHGPHLPLSTDNDILEAVLWEGCGGNRGHLRKHNDQCRSESCSCSRCVGCQSQGWMGKHGSRL